MLRRNASFGGKKMKVGQKAPDFKLTDRRGRPHSLKTFKGKPLVVYFYPKDDTPGCTLQAKAYTRTLPQFKKLGYEVVGISGGDDDTKKKFCTKYKLKVTLLSDPAFAIAKKYGAWGPKVFMGRRYQGVHRNTYVLDSDHKVQQILKKVDPESDAATILKLLKGKKLPRRKPLIAIKRRPAKKTKTIALANRARRRPSPRKLAARRKAGSLMRRR